MTALKIVFAGTPEFAIPALEALVSSRHEVVAIYTQPDRPSGRGRKLTASPIKAWAEARNLPVYQPLNFKQPDAVAQLAALQPDILVVIAYGLILPTSVLTIPRLGCINVHASLLPRWRGASPIQQAVLHGDEESGVTIMQLDAGMDTGDILRQVACALHPQETASSLHDKLAQLGGAPLLATLDDLAAECAQPKAQDNSLATHARKISKDDAAISWSASAVDIDRLIRAFNPWPIAYTHLNNDVLRIHQARVEPQAHAVLPGTVLSVDKTGLIVATGHQCLRLESIQFSGGKVISIADWLNTNPSHQFKNLVFQ
jgi:methionyl-tRNA formyltransferase